MALSARAKELGNKLMFPRTDYGLDSDYITYRQWLIGQCLAGGSHAAMDAVNCAHGVIHHVDTLLEALAGEVS